MRPVHIWLMFLGLCAILYSNTMMFPFVFDDHRVVADPSINLMFQRTLNPNRSVVNFTFLINKFLHGGWLPGFRMINILIHATNAFVLYAILNLFAKIFYNKNNVNTFSMSAFFASLLFLCHPTTTQSVTYISQRFNSLATLFFLLTILFYLKYLDKRINKYFWLSLTTSIAAYLSKEFTVCLIGLLVCIEWLKPQKETLFLIAKRVSPFLLLSLTLPILHIWPLFNQTKKLVSDQLQTNNILPTWAPESISRLDYALTQLHVFSEVYLINFFYPMKLNIDHDFKTVTSFSSIELYLTIAYSAIVLCALILKNKLPAAAFGILWVFITIAPTSSIIPNTEIAADHRFYLPMIGILFFLFDVMEHKNITRKTLTFMMIIPFVLSLLTIQRNQVWKSEESLWLDAHAKSPLKTRPLINLGGTYLDQAKYLDALNCANNALKLEPKSFKALYLAGRAHEAMQANDKAWNSYEQVYNILRTKEPKPVEFYKATIGLSILLYQAKNYQAARTLLIPLEKNRNELKETYRILTYIEFSTGNHDLAKRYLQKALSLNAEFPEEFLEEFK